MSVIEKTVEKFLRDTAGIKPNYVTTMMFVSNCIMRRDKDDRRKKRKRKR